MKNGIDFFSFDTCLDDKFALLEAEFGLTGFGIVVKLYQKIYGERGYYVEWTNEVALLFGHRNGLGGNVVSEITSAAIKRGIFDSTMYEKYGILTSMGIQKRYFEAVSRRKIVEIDKRYLLVDCAQILKNVNIIWKNVDISAENVDISEHSKGKERKEKESMKDTDVSFSPEPENSASGPPPVIALPLNDNTEYEVPQKDFDSWVSLYPAVDVMQQLRNMKGWLQANPDRRKTRRGINRFISGWLSREQDRGGARPAAQAARPMSQGQAQGDQVLAALREMYEQADGGMPPMEMGG